MRLGFFTAVAPLLNQVNPSSAPLNSTAHGTQTVGSELGRIHLALVQHRGTLTLVEQRITDITTAVQVMVERRARLPGLGIRM